MARHPRLILPGVALHVVQRGNNRAACFTEDGDYLTYLAHLRHLSGKYACEVHAYCLMTNHVHLLLTPGEPEACALLMRDLGRSYVPYFNRRNARTGTLWEGRFKSCLTQSARYVLACYRYIELNPVRAGISADASAYPWSSHRVNTGLATDPFVKAHAVFQALGNEEQQRRASYRGLFRQGLDASLIRSIREATQGGYPLASETFKSAMPLPPGCRTQRGKPGPRVEAPTAVYVCEPG